jgi:CheY-like chemotaxis protein
LLSTYPAWLRLVPQILVGHKAERQVNSSSGLKNSKFEEKRRATKVIIEDKAVLRTMIPQRVLCGVTVVVVEDDDVIRSLVAEFLRQQGARVIDCSNAAQALEAVTQERPNVVLSDISLPGGDGFQLLQSIHSLDPEIGGNTAAIAMSALGAAITSDRALAAGFRSYLRKPFTPWQLLQAIQAALRPQN